MKKSHFIEATKGMHNSIRTFNGITVAKVTFRPNNSWRLVPKHYTFEQAAEDNADIPSFYYREELWDYIKKNNL